MSNSSSLKYIPQLDSLRSIAIFLVLLSHFINVNETNMLQSSPIIGAILTKIGYFGLTGVTLFFILSGYLITKILIYSKSSKNFFSSFYIRRMLRIFPLYYLVLCCSLILYPYFFPAPHQAEVILDEQFKLWLFISNVNFFHPTGWDTESFPNFGHFWTLAVEEHFYLLWPLLIYTLSNKKLIFTMIFIYFFSIASWFLGLYISFFTWTTLTYASALSLGGIIAYTQIFHTKLFKSLLLFIQNNLYIFLLLLITAIILPRNLEFTRDFLVYIITLIIFSALLILSVNDKIHFLHSRFLIFIGKISYGIYIFHALLRPYFKEVFYEKQIFVYGIENAIYITLFYTLISSLISILLAWISWEFFEKRVLQLKAYFPFTNRELKD